MKLTMTNLLASMRPGRDYTAAELAQRFDEPTTTVRDMLCTLIGEGRIQMASQSSRILRFRRLAPRLDMPADTQDSDASVVTSVATVPVTRILTGNLHGYDTTRGRHRALGEVIVLSVQNLAL